MLSDEQIRQALHASHVVPLAVATPHGPLGLEQLVAAVSRVNPALGSGDPCVRRPIALDYATWEKEVVWGMARMKLCTRAILSETTQYGRR